MVCVAWKLSGSMDHWTLGFIDRYTEIVKGFMHMHINATETTVSLKSSSFDKLKKNIRNWQHAHFAEVKMLQSKHN